MKALIKNKLFLFGAIICLILTVISTLGYLITPDSSTNANTIVHEWKNLKPGAKVLYIDENSSTPNAEINLWELWWNGSPSNNHIKPILPSEITQYKHQQVYSKTFWMGSDQFGRDMLSRMIIGGRVSLSIGFLAMISSLLIGTFIGLLSGFLGGLYDKFFSWLIAVFWSVPTLLIAMGLSMFLPKGFYQVLLATALSTWVEVARVVRGQAIQLREREYILAAKINGFSSVRIMFLHILPNLKGSLTVLATTNFASSILLEAGLGFLGLGVSPPTPTWGMMVKENMGYLVLDNASMALIPGIAIMILVMAFNLMSMGLRDVLDPRTTNQ